MNSLVLALQFAADEKPPEAKDVVAGWTAFAIFLLLIAAVALLCWSMVRQLRKAQAAKDAGVYGDEPAEEGADGADPEATDEVSDEQVSPDRDT